MSDSQPPVASPAQPETSVSSHVTAIVFVLLLPTISTGIYFVLLSDSRIVQGVYFASKVVQFGFPLAWVLWAQKKPIRLQRPNWTSIRVGALFGLAGVALGLTAYFAYFKNSPAMARAPDLIGLFSISGSSGRYLACFRHVASESCLHQFP